MNRLFLALTVFSTLMLLSCGSNDPGPSACFSIEKTVVSGYAAIFENCSENAVNYEWKVRDGTIEDTYNFSHTFSESGLSSISLFAFNNDGEVDEFEREIYVDDPYFGRLELSSYPKVDYPLEVIHLLLDDGTVSVSSMGGPADWTIDPSNSESIELSFDSVARNLFSAHQGQLFIVFRKPGSEEVLFQAKTKIIEGQNLYYLTPLDNNGELGDLRIKVYMNFY